MRKQISELDLFFLSYDEPNAEKHWADLLNNCLWAKRVHGVKGFDAVHRAAAEASSTEWFVTVDADNVVLPALFEAEVELDHPLRSYTFTARNMLNGARYGNGGVKVWSRAFALGMNTHERSDHPRKAVDFCWEEHYRHLPDCYSEMWPNGSPYQAFRVGFREAVKLTLKRGVRLRPEQFKTRLHAQNLRNLRLWGSVGADREHGLFALLGTRLGLVRLFDLAWDHTVIRDYDWFAKEYGEIAELRPTLTTELARLGREIKQRTGIALPLLDAETSEFCRSMVVDAV